MVPQRSKFPPPVWRGPIQPLSTSIGEQHHGQPHEDEEADMEGESDEVEQDESEFDQVASLERGHEIVEPKAMPIRKRSGTLSSGSACYEPHGPRPEFSTNDWIQRAIVAIDEGIVESLHEEVVKEEEVEKDDDDGIAESDEPAMDSDDYECYTAEPVEPEHFQCIQGDQPVSVMVYDLTRVPNKQLVAELARRLSDCELVPS